MSHPDPRRRAYHESGHAIICILLGYTPTSLSIKGDWEDRFYGECKSQWSRNEPESDELMIKVCLAGACGEELIGEVDEDATCGNDMQQAGDYAEQILRDRGEWRGLEKLTLFEDSDSGEYTNNLEQAVELNNQNEELKKDEIIRQRVETRMLIQQQQEELQRMAQMLENATTLDDSVLREFANRILKGEANLSQM